MPWWVTLILIVAGCCVLAVLCMLPMASAWGSVIGSVAKMAGQRRK